jgi:CubicO group peptidase (beta-lactamase class C family)
MLSRRGFVLGSASAAGTLSAVRLSSAAPAPTIDLDNLTAGAADALWVTKFCARFEAGAGAVTCARYAGRDAFAAADARAIAHGLRLVSIDLYLDGTTVWCTGVWAAGEGRSDLRFATQWNDLQQHFNQAQQAGLGLVDLAMLSVDGGMLYAGIWREVSAAQTLSHDLERKDFDKLRETFRSQGMALIKAGVRADASGKLLLTGLFQAGPIAENGFGVWGNWREFAQRWQTDGGRNNVVSLQALDHGVEGAQAIVAVYLPSTPPSRYVLTATPAELVAAAQTQASEGYVLRSVSTVRQPANWAAAFTQSFRNRAVGYSFAVVREGVPLETWAAGVAMRSGPQMTTTTPVTLGSVSKTIETVAMLLAIQQQSKVTLQTPFFSVIDGFRGISAAQVRDPFVQQITILDLLTHTAGIGSPSGREDTERGLWDYMRTYIGQRRDQQLLGPDGRGGQVYRYSNGGFIAIRGIIEAMTGAASYENWVVQNVLTPIGVSGRTTYLPDPGRRYDIRYYQRTLAPARGDPPGTIPHEASWNSCAADMGRLLAALRGNSLLNAASMQAMLTPYPLPYHYDQAARERRPFGGWICPGFDASGPRPRSRLQKNGTYTDHSQAAIVRFEDAAIDVSFQTNTDTAINPVTRHTDRESGWPETVIANAFNRLIP